jgi:hypothetical protein
MLVKESEKVNDPLELKVQASDCVTPDPAERTGNVVCPVITT